MLFGRLPDPKVMEVYNDFNSNLTNLYACVKNHTMEFLRQLGFLPLNGRDEFLVLRRFLEGQEFNRAFLAQELELARHNLSPLEFEELCSLLLERAAPGDVQRAAALYKVIRYSYGSGCTSFGCQPFDVRKTFHLIWQAADRLANTVIENKDFEALIRQYDRENAFLYCDPPYFMTEDHYEVEFPRQDHVRLRETLAGCQGKTLDSIKAIRELKDLGIGVYFEKERVNTLMEKSEQMITILSSIAQGESESISTNNKWSVVRRFRNGTFIISSPPYGYENNEYGELVIKKEEAEIVRWIFDEYLGGKGSYTIAVELETAGIPTIRGAKEWQASVVKGICCFRKPIRPMESHSFVKTTGENCPSI